MKLSFLTKVGNMGFGNMVFGNLGFGNLVLIRGGQKLCFEGFMYTKKNETTDKLLCVMCSF